MIPVLKTDGKTEFEFLSQLKARNSEVGREVTEAV